eukprot:5393328-Karenia_brevis.AAC.1
MQCLARMMTAGEMCKRFGFNRRRQGPAEDRSLVKKLYDITLPEPFVALPVEPYLAENIANIAEIISHRNDMESVGLL